MKFLRSMYAWIVDLLSPHVRGKRDLGDKALKVLQDMDRSRPKGTSTFDPNSDRAKQGLAFQAKVFDKLKSKYSDNDTFEETWEYFKRHNPQLTIYELACLEKEWGDITFIHEGQRFWVECCFAMGKQETWFCEMKRMKFRGVNKFYCWGKNDDPEKMWFIPSKQWNAYVEKCTKIRIGKKTFRIVPKHLIGDNIRTAKRGVDEFVKFIA